MQGYVHKFESFGCADGPGYVLYKDYQRWYLNILFYFLVVVHCVVNTVTILILGK